MEAECCGLGEALGRLDEIAPKAPLLALGQTVLWDEPVKSGIALELEKSGSKRKFVAGVHDTDYFAKLPMAGKPKSGFKAMPHNATSTRDLWSAAGEFSALFGSETVITRQDFLSAGLKLEKVLRQAPEALDQMSEAYGWRGVVALDEEPRVVAELPLASVYPELRATLSWAIEQSLACVAEPFRAESHKQAQLLLKLADDYAANEGASLADYYRKILPALYALVAGSTPVNLETTSTTQLLKFNLETCDRKRFEIVELFLNPETRDAACEAYNQALANTETYTLDRFGTGALPFDLYIPGVGRGTLRIGNRGLVVMARKPQSLGLRTPLRTVRDLASAIEDKFGRDCVLIGKAVTLIGQLAKEYVFIFHEGASSYVKYSRRFHELLEEKGLGQRLHPILRVRYRTWDALRDVPTSLVLPEPLRETFKREEISAQEFAARWHEVRKEQTELLGYLATTRRPMDLIRLLQERLGGEWHRLAAEYEDLHARLERIAQIVDRLRAKRHKLYARIKQMKARRVETERAKGEQFRKEVFEKQPPPKALTRRKAFEKTVEETIEEIAKLRDAARELIRQQKEIVSAEDVRQSHKRRREIELQAELARMSLIRNAIISTRGLEKAARRPSAWWFPLLSPDGRWFATTIREAQCFFEPLSKGASRGLEIPRANPAGPG